jgi:hypothetical protein
MSGDPNRMTFEQITIGPVEFWFCEWREHELLPDQDTVLRALEDARQIRDEYIAPGLITRRGRVSGRWPCSTEPMSSALSIG